jgi:hypothetical protein
MIRPLTCLCLAASVGSGLYLYSEKHQAAMLDREISRVIHATQAARERTGLLQAEWALLNEPGRLQEMADRYLQLKPMAPSQFVQLSDLATHLPAPVAPPPEGSTDDDAAPVPIAGDPAAAPPAPSVAAVQVAEKPARPPAHAAPKLLAKAEPSKPPHRITVADREAPAHEGALAHGVPLPLAAPQPIGASVLSAMARPMHLPRARPAIVAAIPAYAAPAYVGTSIGGNFGNGRSALPPPVPLGAGER